jgi:lipopolysaccharide heptosyltransferase I
VDRILIVRLSAIGDVIHTLPVLHALRVTKPRAHIGWVVEEPAAELLRGHPELNVLHVIPRKRWRTAFVRSLGREIIPFFRGLRSERYDVALDVQGLTKSGLVAWLSGARRRIGFGDKDGRELDKIFTNRKVAPRGGGIRHVIQRNLALLEPLGIHSVEVEFLIPLADAHERFVEEFFQREGIEGKPIALNPGAGWITKRWALERFAQLAPRIQKELRRQVIICWGPGEESMAREIVRVAEQEGAKVTMIPRAGLLQLAAILKRCAAFVGGDTAPTHLAAAVGTPVVSFFGASDARRNAPWGARNIALQKKDLPCVPCWKTRCPLSGQDYLRCLKEITVEEVFNALLAVVK